MNKIQALKRLFFMHKVDIFLEYMVSIYTVLYILYEIAAAYTSIVYHANI